MVILLVVAALLWRHWHQKPHHGRDFGAESHGSISGRPHVSDGDSLTFDDARVRLLGIDAPEAAQSCGSGIGRRHACGDEARDHLSSLIGWRSVTCDWSRLDKYGRRLARCRAGDLDLNAAMVRDGWAVAYGGHEAEEAEARAAKRGIWSGQFEWPEDWRRDHRPRASWWRGWFDD